MITINSAQVTGLDARIIPVEVDVSPGLHIFSIVGLADKEVQESRERVSAALRNINARSPSRQSGKVIVSLAPADIKKEGTHFDLPIALGYLLASKQASFTPDRKLFLGELGLDGGLRTVPGVLLIALAAEKAGLEEIYVPKGNGAEAALVKGLRVYEATNLDALLDHLEQRSPIEPRPFETFRPAETSPTVDFAEIQGQEHAKRAMEIAAAGNHNILLWGPPGSGKTMLAKAFPGILPPLAFEEALEVAKIQSITGLLRRGILANTRPIRAPHHTASPAAIIGGGANASPGEVTLAHRGVLFLDEFPEFQRSVIEALREPLEEKLITVARAKGKITYPAHIILVAAMNPCPCGNKYHPKKECVCREHEIQKYQKKISGPILDRIDLCAEVPFMEFEKIQAAQKSGSLPSSKIIRENVIAARALQAERFSGRGILTNSDMSSKNTALYCRIPREAEENLRLAISKYGISTRSYYRILKVSRTIADLEQVSEIQTHHVMEALQYRPTFEV